LCPGLLSDDVGQYGWDGDDEVAIQGGELGHVMVAGQPRRSYLNSGMSTRVSAHAEDLKREPPQVGWFEGRKGMK
jgi:hypothetical protein